MNFGGDTGARCSATEARRVVTAFLDAGHRLIDTADVYTGGESERIVGRAIRGRRGEVLLATKGGSQNGLSRCALTRALEGSLDRLGTDYVDLYQCHVPDDETAIEDTMSALDGFVRSGKVRFAGCSNFSADGLIAAQRTARELGVAAFTSLQAHYSLVAREVETDVLPACREYGLGVLAYAPLGGGMLTGRYTPGEPPPLDSRIAYLNAMPNPLARRWGESYLTERNFAIADKVSSLARESGVPPATIALGWLAGRNDVTSIIIGPRSVEQTLANLAGLQYELATEQRRLLDEVSGPRP